MEAHPLADRVAVVTGAGRGVGRAIAVALAGRGARVVLVARHSAQLEETSRIIAASAGSAAICAIDVTRATDVLTTLKTAVETTVGVPQVLINGAGIFGPVAPFKDGDPARWIETFMVNTIGSYLTCRAFVQGMIASGWGRIVNISSAASLLPPAGLDSAYATSKVALNHMTRYLAAELAGSGVTANVIHPGEVKTEMWQDIKAQAEALGPEGHLLRTWVDEVGHSGGDAPEKAADLVLRLVDDGAAQVNGQFLWIDGGLRAPIETGWRADPL